MSRPDVVVIGAGVNGLVAAALLADGGRSVQVVERREVAGGLAAGEEFHPGYRTAGLLHDTTGLRPWIVEALNLERHGLQRAAAPGDVYAAEEDGPGIRIPHDPEEARGELAAASPADAESYARYRAFLARLAPVARRLFDAPPPDTDGAPSLRTVRDAWALRRLGREEMMEVLRLAPMCLADWLGEQFASERLACALALGALTGGPHGPWAPATNALLVRREVLAGGSVVHGPAGLVDALLVAASARGVKVRLSAEVTSIRIVGERAVGVTLASGEEVEAGAVLATCDPKTTVLRLLPRFAVSPHVLGRLRGYRCRGSAVKVHLALDRPFRFAGRSDLEVEHARTGGTFDELERAFDPVKYGGYSEDPVLDIHVPSVGDPSLAPSGHAVVSILAHGAARELTGGWNDGERERVGDAVVRVLARHAPDAVEGIVAREVLTPADIEGRYGTWGGDLNHGDHGLDQLLARPCPECSRYRTPWRGLFLGSAGSWPGGGITGAPGALAAAVVLSERAHPV